MKKSVAITISDEKLAALEMYLEQKNIKLSDEIDTVSYTHLTLPTT